MPEKISPCQGWDPDTCRKTNGCTYVRGRKRRYCRRKRRRQTAKKQSLSPQSRMRLVIRELEKDKPYTGAQARSVKRGRKKQRSRVRSGTRRAPHRPRGERARLLRIQGQIMRELSEAVKLARRASEQNAPRVRSQRGPHSARQTRSSASNPDVLAGRALETLSI
jgi:hypothetical protein